MIDYEGLHVTPIIPENYEIAEVWTVVKQRRGNSYIVAPLGILTTADNNRIVNIQAEFVPLRGSWSDTERMMVGDLRPQLPNGMVISPKNSNLETSREWQTIIQECAPNKYWIKPTLRTRDFTVLISDVFNTHNPVIGGMAGSWCEVMHLLSSANDTQPTEVKHKLPTSSLPDAEDPVIDTNDFLPLGVIFRPVDPSLDIYHGIVYWECVDRHVTDGDYIFAPFNDNRRSLLQVFESPTKTLTPLNPSFSETGSMSWLTLWQIHTRMSCDFPVGISVVKGSTVDKRPKLSDVSVVVRWNGNGDLMIVGGNGMHPEQTVPQAYAYLNYSPILDDGNVVSWDSLIDAMSVNNHENIQN